MPFYKANTLALNNAGFEGTWNYSGDILTYITPADRTGSLQVELASRYSDGSAIIDIDGSTVPSYSDTISVAAGSTVTVVPTITGSSATGVEVMYNPTESLTTVAARFVVPAGLSGSYDANTSWESFDDIDPLNTSPAFYRPTRNELDAAIEAAALGDKSKGSTLLNATLGGGQTLSNALIYGGTTIEELGGSWSDTGLTTSVGGKQIYVAELAPDEGLLDPLDTTPYGVDLIRTDIDQLVIPMDSEITNNDNAPPIMQVLPNVLPDRRVFTIAVDRNTVMKFSSNTAQEDNYAQIVTTDGPTTYGGFDSEGDPLPDEYTTPDGNVQEIRFLTKDALNASRGVTSFNSNPVKDELEQNLTSEQLLGNDYFTINQHCGPNINASRTYRYDPGESGGADELQYDGILRAMEWDHGTKAYVDGEGGSYYQYISGAVSGNPEKLNDNEWCLIHKSDGRVFIYYAPDYGDSVSTPTTKATFMFPVLSKALRVGENSTINNCEIACFGKYADTSEGAITTTGSFVTVQDTDVICTATGLRGKFKLIDRCNIIWSVNRNAACTNDWDATNTSGFHTIVRDSTFRFSQIKSGIAMLNGTTGPARQSPPVLIERNLLCTPVTCHGQGLSLYKSAYQNATVRENAFLDFTRAASFQDVSDITNQAWVVNGTTYQVRSGLWIMLANGVQTDDGWKSDTLVDDLPNEDFGIAWGVEEIYYDAFSGEITLEFGNATQANAFNAASASLTGKSYPSSSNYDITLNAGVVSGSKVVYSDGNVTLNSWGGTLSALLYSSHYNFMTGMSMPVKSSDSSVSSDKVGLKVTNNLFYQGTVFSPPESGQSYISHNGGDLLMSDDDGDYPGRWLFESNTVSLDPAVLTDASSPAAVDTGYNYNIFNLTVAGRMNDFGHRPVIRNNVLSTAQVSSADEPNPITGFDGSDTSISPKGHYKAYNGGLDFQTVFKDRFPGNNIFETGWGHNDLPDVPLNKFSSVFNPDSLAVTNEWATGSADGGKLGIRWSGLSGTAYRDLLAAKDDWWTTMGLGSLALDSAYSDTDGLIRPNAQADRVIGNEDFRTVVISSITLSVANGLQEFTGQTVEATTSVTYDGVTTLAYDWSLIRTGGGSLPSGMTITNNGDGTASIFTGTALETDTLYEDIEVHVTVSSVSATFDGWAIASDSKTGFVVSDSVPSAVALSYPTSRTVPYEGDRYYRFGGSYNSTTPWGVVAWPSEALPTNGDSGLMEFKLYMEDSSLFIIITNMTTELQAIIDAGLRDITFDISVNADAETSTEEPYSTFAAQSGTLTVPAGVWTSGTSTDRRAAFSATLNPDSLIFPNSRNSVNPVTTSKAPESINVLMKILP